MVLRRIIVDNIVKYIPKSEQIEENEPIKMKNRKQSEKIQPNSGGGKPTRENRTKVFHKKMKNS